MEPHRRGPDPARRPARSGAAPTSTAPTGWSPTATCRPSWSPAAANGCARWSASKPRGGHFLHFLAFEIGRGPDGDWWVLGDRTQAPSGAGFALENRVATARVYADLFAEARVHRLAGFFRTFRDALQALSPEPGRPRRDPDARPAQRHLFRARLYRALSRLHAARGRGPDRRRRPGDGAHRRRPAAAQRAVAAPRRDLRRSARARRRTRASARPASSARSARARSRWSTRSARACSRRAPCSPSCRASPRRCSASR